MGGLLVYLAGPGRSNEHSEPHLVAGDSAIMAWHDDAELDRDSALQVAWAVDHPRRAFETVVARGSVWHCSLSLHQDEGLLPDEKWAQISEEFVAEMGFAGQQDGPAPCRWVALRHGLSKAGNDHVHVVVSLVREDGSTASIWNDRPNAQRVAGELEHRHGLTVLESRQAGRGSRGHKPGERARAQRSGLAALPRETLARTVRACAGASADEAEFVRRLRQAGIRARPRYAAGRGDVVSGYSVALRPARGQAPIWYSGGHLERDLTLPRLRASWPDSPQAAAAAVHEWAAAKRNQASGISGREAIEPDPELWARCSSEIAELRERLRTVPPGDRATWAHVAGESAAAFAAWSLRVEPTPGPLAATAESLARSAQLRAHAIRPRQAPLPSLRGASLLLASIAHGGQGTVAQAALLRQLANVAKALHDSHQAAGEAQRAAAIERVVREQLATVGAAMPAPAAQESPVDEQALQAARLASQGQMTPRVPGSPVPALIAEPAAKPPVVPVRETEIQR
jgi:hypothetical protein